METSVKPVGDWYKVRFYKAGESKKYKMMCCKSWLCPVCSRRKAWKYSKQIENMVNVNPGFLQKSKLGKRLVMWTLGTSLICDEAGIKKFQKVWDIFRKFINSRKIKYIGVIESGESNRLHLHIVFNQYIDHADILKAWRASTKENSNVNYSVQIGNTVGKYMSKYMTKTSQEYYEMSKQRTRRLRYSKGLEKLEERLEIKIVDTGQVLGGKSRLEWAVENDGKIFNGLQVQLRISPKSGEIMNVEGLNA